MTVEMATKIYNVLHLILGASKYAETRFIKHLTEYCGSCSHHQTCINKCNWSISTGALASSGAQYNPQYNRVVCDPDKLSHLHYPILIEVNKELKCV